MRSIKDYLLLFVKGLGMGAADIVPGVSGGTIAFITEIYEELLDTIKSLDKTAVQLLFKFKIKELWVHINGNFLLALVSGIAFSILTFARVIHYFMEEKPIQLWSFFFGLVFISSFWVFNSIKVRSLNVVIAGIIGAAIAYFITSAAPATTPDSHWMIFLSGAIAICAMILPGISGSFILLILGKYQSIIGAVKDFDIVVIVEFAFGCIVGLLSFSRVVSWLLKKYHDATVSLLAGFMLGSLNKLWPWKETLTIRINSAGEKVPFETQNIMPTQYMNKTGEDPLILQAIIFICLGIVLVIGLEKIAKYIKESKKYA